jgi:hypothetical protein
MSHEKATGEYGGLLSREDCHVADGIIKRYGSPLEILLLEASGCFGSTERSKIAFNHHKGLFGALAMLKDTTIKPICLITILIYLKEERVFVEPDI